MKANKHVGTRYVGLLVGGVEEQCVVRRCLGWSGNVCLCVKNVCSHQGTAQVYKVVVSTYEMHVTTKLMSDAK